MASSAFLGRFQRAAELEAGEAYAIHDEKRLDLHAGAHCYHVTAARHFAPGLSIYTLKIRLALQTLGEMAGSTVL